MPVSSTVRRVRSGPTDSPPGAKRDAILRAAIDVFAERGYFNAQVADVARAAGVAAGTVYLYFHNKDHLLTSIFDRSMRDGLAESRTAVAELRDPRERLKRLAHGHLARLGNDRNLAIVFQVELRQSTKFMERFSATLLRDYLGLIRAAIADGQQSGLFRTDIKATVAEFAQAAKNAIAAGFDGIELHSANGYLLEQFIRPTSNQRTDRYGGAIENRARFVLEVVDAVIKAIGKDRIGIRLSPFGVFNDMPAYAEMEADYAYLARQLNASGLVYIHLVDHSSMGAPTVPDSIKAKFRSTFKRTLILSGGYDDVRAETDLDAGKCDLVAFARPFLANPDLVRRWKPITPGWRSSSMRTGCGTSIWWTTRPWERRRRPSR